MSIVVDKEVIVKDKDLKGWLDRITELEKENKKLKNKIKNLKFVRRTIENCVVLAFLCLICSGVVCMFIETMIDVITGFQFVRLL